MSTTFMKFSDTFRTPQVNCPLCSLCPFPPPSNPVTTDLSVSYLTLVCLCVHMFVVLVWECVEARGWPWVCAHLMFWGQGLSLNLEITSWARLASQQVPGIPVSLSPWGWDYRCPSVPFFFFFVDVGRHCLCGRHFADSLPALSFVFNYYALVCVPYNQSILPSRLCQFGSFKVIPGKSLSCCFYFT